ncbi:hypothetical protein FQZ97_1095600 [compost metagenome]
MAIIASAATANGDRNAKFGGSRCHAAHFILIFRDDDEIAEIMTDVFGQDRTVPEIIAGTQFDLLGVVINADTFDFGAKCCPVIDALWCDRIHGVLRLNYSSITPDDATRLRTADEVVNVCGVMPDEIRGPACRQPMYAVASNETGG